MKRRAFLAAIGLAPLAPIATTVVAAASSRQTVNVAVDANARIDIAETIQANGSRMIVYKFSDYVEIDGRELHERAVWAKDLVAK